MMLNGLLTLLGFISLLVSTQALPTPVYESNAQRLARGLPPLPPIFRRTLPGYAYLHARDTPTPVLKGRRAAPSPSPSPSVTKNFSGRLEVRDDHDKRLGFVGRPSDSDPVGGINTGSGEDLHVRFTTPISGNTPFEIITTNPGLSPKVFLGAADAGDIDVDLASAIEVSNVDQGSQSSIWFFNRRTKELTAQIINTDGSKPLTSLAYSSSTNKLFFVGDIDAFNAENPGNTASTVKIFLAS